MHCILQIWDRMGQDGGGQTGLDRRQQQCRGSALFMPPACPCCHALALCILPPSLPFIPTYAIAFCFCMRGTEFCDSDLGTVPGSLCDICSFLPSLELHCYSNSSTLYFVCCCMVKVFILSPQNCFALPCSAAFCPTCFWYIHLFFYTFCTFCLFALFLSFLFKISDWTGWAFTGTDRWGCVL